MDISPEKKLWSIFKRPSATPRLSRSLMDPQPSPLLHPSPVSLPSSTDPSSPPSKRICRPDSVVDSAVEFSWPSNVSSNSCPSTISPSCHLSSTSASSTSSVSSLSVSSSSSSSLPVSTAELEIPTSFYSICSPENSTEFLFNVTSDWGSDFSEERADNLRSVVTLSENSVEFLGEYIDLTTPLSSPIQSIV